MKFAVCATIAVAFFGIASPQCTPDQWEGYQGTIAGYAKESMRGRIKEFSSVHYDYTNLRKAVFLSYVNQDYENKFQIIVHGKGKESIMYLYNEKDNSCFIKTIDCPFRKCCVPEKAKCGKEYFLGLSGGFKVQSCEVEMKGLVLDFTFEKKGDIIVPVGETTYGSMGYHVDFLSSTGFVDISPGIKNASVFNIPPGCVEDEEGLMDEFLKREDFVLSL